MSRLFVGVVVSTKMRNTVVVRTGRKFQHPIYRKVVTKHRKFKAHNEGLDLKEGDLVKVKETKPISKDKHFVVIEKL